MVLSLNICLGSAQTADDVFGSLKEQGIDVMEFPKEHVVEGIKKYYADNKKGDLANSSLFKRVDRFVMAGTFKASETARQAFANKVKMLNSSYVKSKEFENVYLRKENGKTTEILMINDNPGEKEGLMVVLFGGEFEQDDVDKFF